MTYCVAELLGIADRNLYYFVRLCKGNARSADIVWVRRDSSRGSLCEYYPDQVFLKLLTFARLRLRTKSILFRKD